MQFNFKDRPQNVNGYGDQPFMFVDPEAHRMMGHITSMDLIENGERAARQYWQKKQFANLVNHAYVQSEFWRARIPGGHGRKEILQNFPILTRKDIMAQVQKEGSLFGDKKQRSTETYETTGSTGTPLKVFICPQNGYYNIVRGFAQLFFDDLPFDQNRVKVTPVFSSADLEKNGGKLKTDTTWAGPLSKLYRNGFDKSVSFNNDLAALLAELSKDPVGYLVCHSRVMEHLLEHGGLDLIEKLGIKVWIHLSDYRSRDAVAQLKQIGVPSLSNYSSGETGPIAYECRQVEGHYHVAHSNVMVECDQSLTTAFENETVGRLLVTHLHSYATPLIRYDIGDFGKLQDRCPCGHDGPTLSHIFGRGKHFLRHPDGRYLPFYLSTRVVREVVDFEECRFRQDAIDTITVQIGGREVLSHEEEERLRAVIIAATDPAFKVVIKPVKKIDWSDNPKQLLFASSVN